MRHYKTILLLILCLTTFACKEEAPEQKSDPKEKGARSLKRTMQPRKEVKFVTGPALKPTKELLSWLEKLPKKKLIRLPIVVRFTDESGLFRKDAFIAESLAELAEDSIFVKLDDTTMGIPLSDHLRQHRPEKAQHCALWLDGFWGPALDMPMPSLPMDDKKDKALPFTIRNVHGVVEGEPSGTVLVSVD